MIDKNGGSNTCRTQINHESRPLTPERNDGERVKSLSRPAKQRFKWMMHFNKYRNARLTCRHFGISPDSFYLWRKRFEPSNLKTLEDDFKTRRPHGLRISKHKQVYSNAVKRLKEMNPHMGKVRIANILKRTGYKISSSTVGRILKNYKD
jgi:transposase